MIVTSGIDESGTPFTGAPKEMLSVVTQPDGTTLVRINSSSLSIMQECWRKFDYSINRNLRSNMESAATLFGSAIHKALEVFYSAETEARFLPDNYEEQMLMIGAGAWEPEWSEYLLYAATRAFVEKAAPLASLPPENKRSIETGVWMLKHYFTQYLDDPFEVLWDSAGPIVERKLSFEIHKEPGLVIEGFGTIDAVLKNSRTGVILVADHKTTSMLGTQFYQRLKPNFQYTFYVMAAQRVLGLQTDSFLVNALQVKEKPKTARGSGPQFARQVTVRTPEDFEELQKAVTHYVKEFLRLREAKYWPMTAPGPCSNYGGCQYHDLCAAPRSLHETMINAKYHTRGTNGSAE